MNSKDRSYYAELGVQPDATPQQIQEAYRRLAKKYHPDLNRSDPAAEERFKQISEAYRVLSDPSRRILINQQEEAVRKARAARKRSTTGKSSSAGFADMFKNMFKGGFGTGPAATASKQPPTRGKDLQIELTVDAVKLAKGSSKKVMIKRDRICPVCGGSGAKPGTKPVQCKICLGIGEIPTSKGGKTVFETCRNCKGSGVVVRERCLHCGGRGIAKDKSAITVNIPPDTKPDSVLTIRGQGNAGLGGGANGDLKVLVTVQDHAYFTTRGNNLIYDYPMNIKELILGGEIFVPTQNGRMRLTLQPGLKQGKMLKIKGKGLIGENGEIGDLLVRINYHIPDKMTAKAEKLLDQLLEQPGWKPDQDNDGFVLRKTE